MKSPADSQPLTLDGSAPVVRPSYGAGEVHDAPRLFEPESTQIAGQRDLFDPDQEPHDA